MAKKSGTFGELAANVLGKMEELRVLTQMQAIGEDAIKKAEDSVVVVRADLAEMLDDTLAAFKAELKR